MKKRHQYITGSIRKTYCQFMQDAQCAVSQLTEGYFLAFCEKYGKKRSASED